MKQVSVLRCCAVAICCALLGATGCISSSQDCGGGESCVDSELLSVVAISRHGIRSPTLSQDTMNLYTRRPQGFPQWPAPADTAGVLSTVGQQNAARLGSWYRDFYAARGLLPPRGTCPGTDQVFIYADLFERTLYTAQGYLQGMFGAEAPSNCGIGVKQSQDPIDPYIDTAKAEVCAIDTDADQAVFYARIGGDANNLVKAYSAQLQMLQDVTECCKPAACATPANPNPASCSLAELPLTVNTTGAVSFATGSLFDVADTLTETFELEYAQGMPDKGCSAADGAECVGWGAIPPGGLKAMSQLHVLNMVDLTCRLPSYAQVGSSNLMWQVVRTLEQRLDGVKHPDTIAPAASTFTLFVAHDENVAAIATFLGGVTWTAEGFQPNDPGPAGALVFELHQLKQRDQLVVRMFYVIAALDQMRFRTPLSLQAPPQRIPLPIPVCNGRLDCPFEEFEAYVASHVRQDCLVQAGSGSSRR